MRRHLSLVVLLVVLLWMQQKATAQNTMLKGSVQRIKVHGKSLEGNLDGDSPDRDVSIYLPPSYNKDLKRRYPVIYFLHGYTDDDAKWFGFQKHWINLPRILDSVFAAGGAKEMIVVMPNAYTRFQGSFYSNSVTTGNWEDFVAKELVAYIDAHYRTIANVNSRGLAGHSMGGYGSLRIGQDHPEIFSSVYLLSPCCLMPNGLNQPLDAQRMALIESVKTDADFLKADFGTKAVIATAAVWAPDPAKPPFYLDLPFENGQRNPVIDAKMQANMPIITLDQHIFYLRQLRGLAFDAGTHDEAIAASLNVLDSALNKYKLQHNFELYDGDHLNHIAERIAQKMLPFFTQHLSVAATKSTK